MAGRLWALLAVAAAMVAAGCAGPPDGVEAPSACEECAEPGRDQQGQLRLLVVDSAIRPLGGAQVVLRHVGEEPRWGNTTGNGTFTFEGLAPGAYVVEGRRAGHDPAQ